MEQSESPILAVVTDGDDDVDNGGSVSCNADDSLVAGDDGSTPGEEPNDKSNIELNEAETQEAPKIECGVDENLMEEIDELPETENIHMGGITGISVGDEVKGRDPAKDALIDESAEEAKNPAETEHVYHKGEITGISVGDDVKGGDTAKDALIEESAEEAENPAETEQDLAVAYNEEGAATDVVLSCFYGCSMIFSSNEVLEQHLVTVHMWEEVKDGPETSAKVDDGEKGAMCEEEGESIDNEQLLPGAGEEVFQDAVSNMEDETMEEGQGSNTSPVQGERLTGQECGEEEMDEGDGQHLPEADSRVYQEDVPSMEEMTMEESQESRTSAVQGERSTGEVCGDPEKIESDGQPLSGADGEVLQENVPPGIEESRLEAVHDVETSSGKESGSEGKECEEEGDGQHLQGEGSQIYQGDVPSMEEGAMQAIQESQTSVVQGERSTGEVCGDPEKIESDGQPLSGADGEVLQENVPPGIEESRLEAVHDVETSSGKESGSEGKECKEEGDLVGDGSIETSEKTLQKSGNIVDEENMRGLETSGKKTELPKTEGQQKVAISSIKEDRRKTSFEMLHEMFVKSAPVLVERPAEERDEENAIAEKEVSTATESEVAGDVHSPLERSDQLRAPETNVVEEGTEEENKQQRSTADIGMEFTKGQIEDDVGETLRGDEKVQEMGTLAVDEKSKSESQEQVAEMELTEKQVEVDVGKTLGRSEEVQKMGIAVVEEKSKSESQEQVAAKMEIEITKECEKAQKIESVSEIIKSTNEAIESSNSLAKETTESENKSGTTAEMGMEITERQHGEIEQVEEDKSETSLKTEGEVLQKFVGITEKKPDEESLESKKIGKNDTPVIESESENIETCFRKSSESTVEKLEKGNVDVEQRTVIESQERTPSALVELTEQDCDQAEQVEDVGDTSLEEINVEVVEKGVKVVVEQIQAESHDQILLAEIGMKLNARESDGAEQIEDVGKMDLETDSEVLLENDSMVVGESANADSCHQQSSVQTKQLSAEMEKPSAEIEPSCAEMEQLSVEKEQSSAEKDQLSTEVGQSPAKVVQSSEELDMEFIGKESVDAGLTRRNDGVIKVAEETQKSESHEESSASGIGSALTEAVSEGVLMAVHDVDETDGEKVSEINTAIAQENTEAVKMETCRIPDERKGTTEEGEVKPDSQEMKSANMIEIDVMDDDEAREVGRVKGDDSIVSVKEDSGSSIKDDISCKADHVTNDGQTVLEDGENKDTKVKRKCEGQVDSKDVNMEINKGESDDDVMEVDEDAVVGDQLQMMIEDAEDKPDNAVTSTDLHQKHDQSSSSADDVRMNIGQDVVKDSVTDDHQVFDEYNQMVVKAEKSDKEVDVDAESRFDLHKGEITGARGEETAETGGTEDQTQKIEKEEGEVNHMSKDVTDVEATSKKTITCALDDCTERFVTKNDAEKHFMKDHKGDVSNSEEGEKGDKSETVKDLDLEAEPQVCTGNEGKKSDQGDIADVCGSVAESSCSNKLTCPICSSSFPNMDEMLKHHAADHKQISCKYCQRVFSSFRIYIAHEAAHHDNCKRIRFDEGTKIFELEPIESMLCDSCGMLIDSEQSVQCHTYAHERSKYTEKRFECMWCPKIFNCRSDMELHASKVLNQFINSCSSCQKNFFSLAELDKHLEESHQSSEYLCADCKVWFHGEAMYNLHRTFMHKDMSGEKAPVGTLSAEKTSEEQGHTKPSHTKPVDSKNLKVRKRERVEEQPAEKTLAEMSHTEPVDSKRSKLCTTAPVETPVETPHAEKATVETTRTKQFDTTNTKVCKFCGLLCTTDRVRYAHEYIVHRSNDGQWLRSHGRFEIHANGSCKITLKSLRTCSKCGKICKSDEACANHRLSHKDWRKYAKKFQCRWCKKTFNGAKALLAHALKVVRRYIEDEPCFMCRERVYSIPDSDVRHAVCDKLRDSYCSLCNIYFTGPICVVTHSEFTHTAARDLIDGAEMDLRRRQMMRLGFVNVDQLMTKGSGDNTDSGDENDIVELPSPEVEEPPEIVIQDESGEECSKQSSDKDGIGSELPQASSNYNPLNQFMILQQNVVMNVVHQQGQNMEASELNTVPVVQQQGQNMEASVLNTAGIKEASVLNTARQDDINVKCSDVSPSLNVQGSTEGLNEPDKNITNVAGNSNFQVQSGTNFMYSDLLKRLGERILALNAAGYSKSPAGSDDVIDVEDTSQPHGASDVPGSSNSLVCDICQIEFVQQSSLVRHMMLIHNEGDKHECAVCSRSFESEEKLQLHKEVHLQETTTEKVTQHACTMCGESFESREEVEVHEETHLLEIVCEEQNTEKVTDQCMFCPHVCSSDKEMSAHVMRCHMEWGFYVCKVCKLQYTNKQALITHNKRASHKANVTKSKSKKSEDWHCIGSYCQLCKTVFKDRATLSSHYKTNSRHVRELLTFIKKNPELQRDETVQVNKEQHENNDCHNQAQAHNRKTLTCGTCNISFNVKRQFKDHLGTVAHQEALLQKDNLLQKEKLLQRKYSDLMRRTIKEKLLNKQKRLKSKYDALERERKKKAPESVTTATGIQAPSQIPIVVNVFSLANVSDSQSLGLASLESNTATIPPRDIKGATSTSTVGAEKAAPRSTTVPKSGKDRLKEMYKKKRRRAVNNCLHCNLCYKTFQDKVALIKHKKYWHKASEDDSSKDGKKVLKKQNKDKRKLKKKKKKVGQVSKGNVVKRMEKGKVNQDDDCEIITLDSEDDAPTSLGQNQSDPAPMQGLAANSQTVQSLSGPALMQGLAANSQTVQSLSGPAPMQGLAANSQTVQSLSSSAYVQTSNATLCPSTGLLQEQNSTTLQSVENGQNTATQQNLMAKTLQENNDEEILILDSDDDNEVTNQQNTTKAQNSGAPGNPEMLPNLVAKESTEENNQFPCHCVGCDSSFISWPEVVLHMLAHNRSKVFTPMWACGCNLTHPVAFKCNKSFDQLFELFVHINNQHDGTYILRVIKSYASSIYKCHYNMCTEESYRFEILFDHMKNDAHEKSTGLSCPHCNNQCYVFIDHFDHISKVHEGRWFKPKDHLICKLENMVYGQSREPSRQLRCHAISCCQFCGSDYELALHMLEHNTSSDKFRCLYRNCNATTTTFLSHFQHIETCHYRGFVEKFVKEYGQCTALCHYSGCTKYFNQSEEFMKHMCSHTDTASLVCPHCTHLSLDLKSHKAHIAHEHSNHWHNRKQFEAVKRLIRKLTSTPYICEFKECFQLFKNREQLQDHVLGHFPWRCHNPRCVTARFTTMHLLRDHVIAHKGCIYDNMCHFVTCSSQFTNEADLNKHEMTAHFIPINVADKETMKLGTFQGLTNTQRTVGKPRGRYHSCQTCDMSFTTAFEYITHTISHNPWASGLVRRNGKGEYVPVRRKILMCQYCNQRFQTSEDVSIHEMLHKDKSESFTCQWCDKVFYSKPSLAIHVVLIISTLQGILMRNEGLVNISFKYVDGSLSRQRLTQEVKCDICQVWFNTQAGFERHKKPLHLDNITSLKETMQCEKTLQNQKEAAKPLPKSVLDVDRQVGDVFAQSKVVPGTMETEVKQFKTRGESRDKSINPSKVLVGDSTVPKQSLVQDLRPSQVGVVDQDAINPSDTPVTEFEDAVVQSSVYGSLLHKSDGKSLSQTYEVLDEVENMDVDSDEPIEVDVDVVSALSDELTYADTQGMEIMCEKCFEHFDEMKQLKKHMKDIHNVLDFKPKPKPKPKKTSKNKYKCKKCPATFSNRGQLKKHKEYHKKERKDMKKAKDKGKNKGHENEVYKCTVCSASFDTFQTGKQTRAAWLNHRHNGSTQKATCSLCSNDFMNDRALQNHKIKAHSSGTVKCPKCSKWLSSTKSMYERHMREHDAKCPVCSLTFKMEQSLTKHIQQRHPGWKDKQKSVEKPSNSGTGGFHKCTQCLLMFSERHLLEMHERQHGEWMHTCEICNMTFTKAGYLTLHRDSVHGQDVVRCKLCSFPFKTERLLANHMDRVHPSLTASGTGGLLYKCSQCPLTFGERNLREEHERLHVRKRYSCDICNMKFLQEELLTRHKDLIHNKGQKKDVARCTICSFPFKTQKCLADHMARVHKNVKEPAVVTLKQSNSAKEKQTLSQKPSSVKDKQKSSKSGKRVLYRCSYCRLMFSERNLVEKHERQHVKVTYNCEICHMMFTKTEFLMRHMESIHKRQSFYECTFCKMRFSKHEFLERHEQNKHRQPSLQRSSGSRSQSKVHNPKRIELPTSPAAPDEVCILETPPVPEAETIDIVSSDEEEETALSSPTMHCGYCTKVFIDTDDMLQHQLGHTKLQIDLTILCHLKMSYGEGKPDADFVIYD